MQISDSDNNILALTVTALQVGKIPVGCKDSLITFMDELLH